MLPVAAQLQMAYADATDLACSGAQTADTVSMAGCALGLAALAFAWWYRARAALEDDHKTWAAISLLAFAAQMLASMWVVPMGCLSWHALSTFAGYASPWIITAALFRSALAPTPEALSDKKSERPGDPFA